MKQLAHVSSEKVQTLTEHLLSVSSLARERGTSIMLPNTAALLGLLHDLGKGSSEFQAYIQSFLPESPAPRDDLRGKIDHSTAGAQVVFHQLTASKLPGGLEAELARLLSLCIASHHGGLRNCVTPSGKDELTDRLSTSEQKSHAAEAWSSAPEEVRAEANRLLLDPDTLGELRRKAASILHDGLQPGETPNDRHHLQLGLLVRFLFSCLIDADRTDTADFEQSAAALHRQNGSYVEWPVLLGRLNEELDRIRGTAQIDRIRAEVSDACFTAAARPPGAYTLTVPTGGGKTLSALRFALEHARIHQKRHIIFVSPYISIVDQNAAVARSVLEKADTAFSSVVLEHHSNLISELGTDSWRRKVLTENWDAPVVFTTMSQVLEALFGAGTRSVRRLHALANSVIVFDEAQTLPVKLVHLFNNAVNFLTRHAGSTVVLCTATQPHLHSVDPVRGALQLAEDAELVGSTQELFTQLKRYNVDDETARAGGWSREDVAALACAEATAYGSCLVVVNTKRDAREIFTLCQEQMPRAWLVHLSTGMCPAHRTEALSTLKARLASATDTQPILCVSTQLIEAGVDIDFASVIRDLAGLDSMAQAAGRCNRHGRRSMGHVTLVHLRDLPKGLEEIRKGQLASERILADWRREHSGASFPLYDPAPMHAYFRQNFFNRKNEMSYDVNAAAAGRDTTLLSLLGANEQSVADARAQNRPVARVCCTRVSKPLANAFS